MMDSHECIMIDSHLGQESKFNGSNKLIKQLKFFYYNSFLRVKQLLLSITVNYAKDEPQILNESTTLTVEYESMHLMKVPM